MCNFYTIINVFLTLLLVADIFKKIMVFSQKFFTFCKLKQYFLQLKLY